MDNIKAKMDNDLPENGQAVSPRTDKQSKQHTFGSICGVCGALLPDGSGHCLVCKAERGAVPYEGAFPVAVEADAPQPEPLRRHGGAIQKTTDLWRRWSRGVSGLILLVMLAFVGLWVYRQYFDTSSYRAKDAIVYETADRRLLLEYPGAVLKTEITGITLERTTWSDGVICPSPNGRWLAYTAATGQLYLLDLAGLAGSGSGTLEATLLAGNTAGEVRFADTGGYLVYTTRDRELYASNLSESWRLDSRVEAIVGVEGRKVLYTRLGDNAADGQADLFLYDMPRDGGEWLTIDRGVVEVLDWTDGFEKMLYTSIRQDSDGADELCLHSFDLKASTTTMLVTGIGDIFDASAATGSVVYGIPKRQQWSIGYFVEDDMAAADARIREPKLEDYPELEEAIRVYGEQGDFYTIEDNEKLLEQDTAYNAAVKAWEEKQERTGLRGHLRGLFQDDTAFLELYDLYAYSAGAVTQLDTGVLFGEPPTRENGTVNVDQGYILYEKVNADSLTRVKMSALWQRPEQRALNLGEYFLSNTVHELRYVPMTGGPATLYVGGGELVHKQWRMTPRGDGVHFLVAPDDEAANGPPGELFYASVRGGAVSEASLVAQGVDRLYQPFREGLLFDIPAGNERELYVAQAGTSTRIGSAGAVLGGVVNGGNTLLYYQGFTEQLSAGNLHMVTREDVLLSENAAVYDYRSDQLVYIQKLSGSGDSMDVYVWSNGHETLLEKDVRGVVPAAAVPG